MSVADAFVRGRILPGPCSITQRHTPGNLTVEEHHIIPVAWQLFWQPTTAPFPGRDPNGRGMLWDARTTPLCPTHHRNAHALIVQAMRLVAAAGTGAVPTFPQKRRSHGAELEIALEALDRFVAVSGSLLELTAAGEWGFA